MAELLVLTAVFVTLIAFMGACFFDKLGKIDDADDEIECNKKGDKKKLWQMFWKMLWDSFTEKCEICQEATFVYIADNGKGGDSFFVCKECGKDFENLREITRSLWIYPTI